MANSTVTLHNGRIVTVTPKNYEQLALEDEQAYARDGIAIDQAAHLQTFRELGGQETAFFNYGPQGAAPIVPEAAQHLLNNSLANASFGIFNAAPAPVQQAWKATSDATLEAGRATWDGIKKLAGAVPGIVGGANDTLRIVAISAAVIAVAAGGAYALFTFKPFIRR